MINWRYLGIALSVFTFFGVSFVLGIPQRSAYADEPTQQVIQLVNEQRRTHGLSPLVVSDQLAQSAQRYADALATKHFFSHTAPDGSTLVTRDEAAGYSGWTWLGENLAAGQESPAEVVQAWMNSPAHRANILSPDAREIGVGHAFRANSPYGTYWVQEFGARPHSPAPTSFPADAPAPSAAGWQAPTGHVVAGAWLAFFQAHGDVDNLGLPRSDVLRDPEAGGALVQYFQRGVLEWHPENPPAARIERRLLGDILYPGADPPVDPGDAPPGPSRYFPISPDKPTGLGHFVANYTRDGQPTYFLDYFLSHGGVDAFGYPKEEPKLRDGIWTQRFQAAVFQYHPDNDHAGLIPGTTIPYRHYRVQLELLGDEYIRANHLPYR